MKAVKVTLINFLVAYVLINNLIIAENGNINSLNAENTTFILEDSDEEFEEYYANFDRENVNDFDSFFDRITLLHSEGRNATISRHVDHINDTFKNFDRLLGLTQDFVSNNKQLHRGFQKISEFFYSLNINLNSECFDSIIKILNAMRNRELWAFKFIDSMGKIPSGMAEGVVSSFGEYDECLNIISAKQEKDSNSAKLQGKYCLLKLIVPYPTSTTLSPLEDTIGTDYLKLLNTTDGYNEYRSVLPLLTNPLTKIISVLNILKGETMQIGICVPSTCGSREIETAINKVLFPLTRLPVTVAEKCDIKEENVTFNEYQTLSLCLFSFLAILTIFSTVYEVYINCTTNQTEPQVDYDKHSQKQSKAKKLLLTFSLITNSRSLMKPNHKFAALYTIKLAIIINLRTMDYYMHISSLGLLHLRRFATTIPSQYLFNSSYILLRNVQLVDPLFIISGIISTYYLLNTLRNNNQSFNYLTKIFRLWLKYSVIFIGVTLVYYLSPLLCNGPLCHFMNDKFVECCKFNQSLVYTFTMIVNFLRFITNDVSTYCMPLTWLISALFQLEIIAIKFVVLYNKRRTIGLYLTICVICLGLILRNIPILYGIKPYRLIAYTHSIEDILDSIKWYYTSSVVYIPSYFVGVVIGYILVDKQYTFNKICEIFLWLLSLAMIASSLIWENTFWKLDITPLNNNIMSWYLWYNFGKFGHTLGFGWIFYSLCSGKAVALNRMLSWSAFRPLTRVSLIVYLMADVITMLRFGNVKSTYVVTHFIMFENLIIDNILLVIISVVLYFLIECPFNNIDKTFSYHTTDKDNGLTNQESNK